MVKTRFLSTVAIILCCLAACGPRTTQQDTGITDTLTPNTDTEFSRPVQIDTANRMIQSYLTGINSTVNTQEIKSVIFDADVLRTYLNQHVGSNLKRIEKFKFIFAHSLDYVNSGNEGKRPDTNSHALTIVIVGIDKDGNYVYTKAGAAMDFAQPCPPRCPVAGTSANDLLVH